MEVGLACATCNSACRGQGSKGCHLLRLAFPTQQRPLPEGVGAVRLGCVAGCSQERPCGSRGADNSGDVGEGGRVGNRTLLRDQMSHLRHEVEMKGYERVS